MLTIAIRRWRTGDQALDDNDFDKALSKYQLAIDQVEALREQIPVHPLNEEVESIKRMPEGTTEGLVPRSLLQSLVLIVQTRMMSIYLGLSAYEKVCRLSDVILDEENEGCSPTEKWEYFAYPHYRTAYICRAEALQVLGRLPGAVDYMVLALRVKPSDDLIFYQLSAMVETECKQAEECDDLQLFSESRGLLF